MKYLKAILGAGLIGALLYLGADVFKDRSYKNELAEERVLIEENLENADELTKDLVARLKDEDPSYIKVSSLKNLSTGKTIKKIDGYDEKEGILISGSLPGEVFIRRGPDRYWINTVNKTYYHDVFETDKNLNIDGLSRAESFVRDNLIRKPASRLEKLEEGFKVTNQDELNKGSYTIYNEEGQVIESYVKNSQGEFLEKLLSQGQDVLGAYDKLKALTDTYEESSRREDFN